MTDTTVMVYYNINAHYNTIYMYNIYTACTRDGAGVCGGCGGSCGGCVCGGCFGGISYIMVSPPYRVGLAFNSFDRRPWAIAVSFCLELLH